MAEEASAMTLVNRLVNLLDDQVLSAENGQFERVERLMAEGAALSDEIVKTRAFDCQAWQASRHKISQKYQRLELILASAREISKGELKHAKTTMKMLAAYRSSNR